MNEELKSHLKYELAMVCNIKFVLEKNMIQLNITGVEKNVGSSLGMTVNNAMFEAFLVHVFCIIDHYELVIHPTWVHEYRQKFYEQVVTLSEKRTEDIDEKVTHQDARDKLFEYIKTLVVEKKGT